MNDKLNILFKQIEFKDIDYFDGGSLDKIICNRAKDKYLFCISLNKIIPLDIYNQFSIKLKNRFNTVGSVNFKLSAEKFNMDELKVYYNFFLDKYSKDAPLLELFKTSGILLDGNNLVISLANKAEEMKFNSIKKELEKDLNYAGFDIKIVIKIDEAKSLDLIKEI